MKAFELRRFGEPLVLVECPDPTPVGTQVVIEVYRCGVCHTDLHLCEGFYNAGGGRRITLEERGVSLPMVLGHEILGTLVGFGPDSPIERSDLGKTFLVYPWIGCGFCSACRQGMDNQCQNARTLGVQQPGGYQQKLLVPHPRYLFDIGQVDPTLAATYACSGLTAYAALKKSSADPADDGLLLVGFGGLGKSGLLLAEALGFRHVAVADMRLERRSEALAMGATLVIDPASPDSSAKLASFGRPFATAIDFVGSDATAQWAIEALCKGGTYVAVGLFGGELKLSLASVVVRALSIIGSYVGSPAELAELLQLADSGAVRPLPTELLALDDINLALERLRSGDVEGRLVLDCSAPANAL